MDEQKAMSSPLERQMSLKLSERRQQARLRKLKASPSDSVDFSSNDFLSLATDPKFRQDLISALQEASQVGSTGSRLLDGNSILAESLELEIAAFHGAPAGLLTNSGFDANVSIFSCLPQTGDVIVYDELIHASVHDGMRHSRAAKCLPFAHNCILDLRKKVGDCIRQYPGKNFFIAVESVYSMDGDLAPLTEIVGLMESVSRRVKAYLIVDEAHATGIYGRQGRGRVSELGLEEKVFVRLHTFGKALACNGAIILTSPTARLYLINYARPLIYTTFLSHPSLAAIKLAYHYLQSNQTAALTNRLTHLIEHLHATLQTLPSSPMLRIPETCPQSPIFALLAATPRSLAQKCQEAGFVVRAVVPPTVPAGTERVRVCLHAGNSEQEIERLVEVVRTWVDGQIVSGVQKHLEGEKVAALFDTRPKL